MDEDMTIKLLADGHGLRLQTCLPRESCLTRSSLWPTSAPKGRTYRGLILRAISTGTLKVSLSDLWNEFSIVTFILGQYFLASSMVLQQLVIVDLHKIFVITIWWKSFRLNWSMNLNFSQRGKIQKVFSLPLSLLSLHRLLQTSAMGRVESSLTLLSHSCWFYFCFLVLFLFFFSPDIDLGALFSCFSSRFKSLNSPDLVLDPGAIVFQSKFRSLINMFSGIRYPYALSVYMFYAFSFSGNCGALMSRWTTKICSFKY